MSKVKFQTIAVSKKAITKSGKEALVFEFDSDAVKRVANHDWEKVWSFDWNEDRPSLQACVGKSASVSVEQLIEMIREFKAKEEGKYIISQKEWQGGMTMKKWAKLDVYDEILSYLGATNDDEQQDIPF